MRTEFSLYIADHWNPIDLLWLRFVGAGLVAWASDWTSSWGRSLYALSAPLIFSGVLDFAQMLRSQGPMIPASPPQPLAPHNRGVGRLKSFGCSDVIQRCVASSSPHGMLGVHLASPSTQREYVGLSMTDFAMCGRF